MANGTMRLKKHFLTMNNSNAFIIYLEPALVKVQAS